jgi:hypothetical protein
MLVTLLLAIKSGLSPKIAAAAAPYAFVRGEPSRLKPCHTLPLYPRCSPWETGETSQLCYTWFMAKGSPPKKITNEKPIPPIPLPFKEVMKDVLKVKPPIKESLGPKKPTVQRGEK